MIAALVISAAHAACTVLVGASVHLVDRVVADGVVVIVDDKIAAAGSKPAGLDLKSGAKFQGVVCERIDAVGRHVTAGLVEVSSQLGLYEIGLETGTHDDDPGGDAIRASFRVVDSYNPDSAVIPIQRVAGVTLAVTNPASARLGGLSALVSLDGATQAETVVLPGASMVASIGGPSSAVALMELREVFSAAREQAARRRPVYEVDSPAAYGASALDLAALAPVLSGDLPLVISANRASDIEALLAFAQAWKVRLVISGGAEAWRLAGPLAAAGVPVIVDPMSYGPGGFDELRARADNAVLLHAAGVPLILSTFGTHQARTLAQVAGNAVRAGLDPTVALTAITATPAQVFGAPDRGRLVAGAVADVVLWSGTPLELSSVPDAVWVEGRRTSMLTRQTLLRDRYRTLPGTPRPPNPVP